MILEKKIFYKKKVIPKKKKFLYHAKLKYKMSHILFLSAE